MNKITGKAFIFGHDIDTHEIIPARYLPAEDIKVLSRHCMHDVDPDFAWKVSSGDMIIAGKNFGCGTGIEQAALALKGLGLSCIIARSFGRIFFRNAINIGLPILECPQAFDTVNQGDQLDVDLSSGRIMNLTKNESYQALGFPSLLKKIIDAGGLMEAIRQKVLK